MSAGKVIYAEHDGFQVLRFIGEIRYTLGPALDRFLKQLCARPAPRGVVIDLTDTESLDSTSLGLLARVAKWLQAAGAPKATLVSTNPDINDLLYSVGFDDVFNISKAGIDEPENAETLQLEESGGPELKAVILEAHRTLIALNGRNRDEFQDVVDLLKQKAESPTAT